MYSDDGEVQVMCYEFLVSYSELPTHHVPLATNSDTFISILASHWLISGHMTMILVSDWLRVNHRADL